MTSNLLFQNSAPRGTVSQSPVLAQHRAKIFSLVHRSRLCRRDRGAKAYLVEGALNPLRLDLGFTYPAEIAHTKSAAAEVRLPASGLLSNMIEREAALKGVFRADNNHARSSRFRAFPTSPLPSR